VLERKVGKFCGPVANQIFSGHQLGVVIVARLDALKAAKKKKKNETFLPTNQHKRSKFLKKKCYP